jgi:hypothetical protein
VHRIEVACLPGEVEEIVLALNEIGHAMRIPDVRDIDLYAIFDARNIEEITTILRDQAINHQNPSAELNQSAREVRANEPERARDQHPSVCKRFSKSHYRLLKEEMLDARCK